MLVRSVLLAAAVALIGAPAEVCAQELATERTLAEAVTISGVDPCLEHDALASAAAVWLGRDHVDAALRVLVDRSETGATVVLFAQDTIVASRTFLELPRECSDRRAVIALAVALGIDAALLDRLAPPRTVTVATEPQETEPQEEVQNEEEVQAEETHEETPSAGSAVAVEMAIEAGAAIGVLADVVALGRGSVGLHVDALRLDLFALGTSSDGQPFAGARLETTLVGAGADACLTHSLAPLELVGCLGIAAGALGARGHGYSQDRDVQLAWVAGLARIEAVTWIADALGLVLAVEGLFPFVRPAPTVVTSGGEVVEVATLPVVAVALTGGLRLRFR